MNVIRRFDRYTKNCGVISTGNGDCVLSYSTAVAKIDYAAKKVIVSSYWSQTTSKHINYVAKELGMTVEKN
jgi:hypothetical protein